MKRELFNRKTWVSDLIAGHIQKRIRKFESQWPVVTRQNARPAVHNYKEPK